MPDEEIIETEEIQDDNEEVKEETKEETKDEIKEETKEESKEVPDEEEEKKSFIQKTLDKLGIGGGDKEPEEKEEEGELISDTFIKAASELGWTDDDIVKFAEKYSDEELEEMIPYLAAEESEPEKKSSAKESEKDSADKSESKDESEVVKLLRQELADLKKEVGAVKEDKAAQEQLATLKKVDNAFDKASETFKVFGKTKELARFPAGPRKGELIPTSPAFKARNEVYGMFMNLTKSGMATEDAIDNALDWYKGRNLEKEVKRNLVKDLKRKEKKLSAKRMGKETVKTYDSEEDRKAEVVREAARKKGVEL